MARKINAELILQLRAEGLSGRAIAVSQSMSRRSIAAVIDADRTGVSWDDIAEQSDDEVFDLLFPGSDQHHSVFTQPDWDKIHLVPGDRFNWTVRATQNGASLSRLTHTDSSAE